MGDKCWCPVQSVSAGLLQSGELRSVVAEGLAKLLMSGRVFSAALLSRLLLLWYNPLAEDDARLRHTLGTFFPIFAFTDRCVFEKAFLCLSFFSSFSC